MATSGGPSFSRARIAVIGAGGIGCAVLPRIARMRIDLLSIIDGDRVERANFDRQPLYEEMDVGRYKASTAAGWMRQLLVGGEVIAHDVFINAGNAEDLLRDRDIVLEGVDDPHAKDLIDRVCGDLGIALISGGVHAKQGQVIMLHSPGSNRELSRRELFGSRIGAEEDGCDMRNVPLSLLEEVGRVMAARGHDLLHDRPVVNGRIELFSDKRWVMIDPAIS
jgi:molybdopterin/thiamine biosynthesis adenylyltransferase